MSLKTHLALNTLPAPYQKMLLAQHPELKADSVVPLKTVHDALAGKPLADTWLRLSAPKLLCSPEDAKAMAQVAKKVYQTVEPQDVQAPTAQSPASAPQASAVSNAPSTQVAPGKVFRGHLKWRSAPARDGSWVEQVAQISNGILAAVDQEGQLKFYNPPAGLGGGPVISSRFRNGDVTAVLTTNTGKLAVASAEGRSLTLFDPIQPPGSDGWTGDGWNNLTYRPTQLALLPNGRIAVAGDDGVIRVCDPSGPTSHSEVWESETVGNEIRRVTAMRNGHLATATDNGYAIVFDPTQPSGSPPVWYSKQHPGAVNDVLELKNGLLAVACADGVLYLHDPTKPPDSEPVYSVALDAKGLRCLGELPDGTLAVGANSRDLLLLDLTPSETRSPVRDRIPFEGALIFGLKTLSDGTLAASTSDGYVRIFE